MEFQYSLFRKLHFVGLCVLCVKTKEDKVTEIKRALSFLGENESIPMWAKRIAPWQKKLLAF